MPNLSGSARDSGSSTFPTVAPYVVPDLSEIKKYWDAIRLPGEIVELRYPTTYLHKKTGKLTDGSRNVRCAGPEELAAAIKRIGPGLTYWVNLQHMKQDASPKPYGAALVDADIECYRWGPFDYDPKRPGKVSATDAEKKNAHAGAQELYEYFKSLGVDPVVIDSGNGFYVLPPIDLSNTPENRDLVARAVRGIKAKFYRESEGLIAKVDGTAVNPGRVFGLTGTMNTKGESTPERPHRPRLLLHAGSRDVLLSVAQLEEMASWVPKPTGPSSAPAGTSENGHGPFTFDNVEQLLTDLETKTEELDCSFDFDDDFAKSTRGPGWLVRCPHDSEHSNSGEDLDGSTVVWMTNRGFPIFHCSHDGADDMPCNKMGWREFIAEWGAGDLQKDIVDPELPPAFVWTLRKSSTEEERRSQSGPLWLFSSEEEYAVFKLRVEQTPAWAYEYNPYPHPDPDFTGPIRPIITDYESWRKAKYPDGGSGKDGFKFPKVPGQVREYTLLPRRAKFDGWFGRGRISLVGGSSGAGKTSLMCDLLHQQWLRSCVLGHVGAGLRPLIIFADRGELSNAETFDRLGLADANLPISHLSVCWDATAAQRILELAEEQNPLPEIVFVEGADTLTSDAGKVQTVAPFLSALQKIAAHYHIAIVLSVGAPKAKPREQHTLKRDRIFGSQIWPRMADTIVTLEAVGDGTNGRRDLTVQHRNARPETFELEFQNDGHLVERSAAANIDALDIWVSEQDPESWFTRNKALAAMKNGETGMGKTKVYDRLKEMLERGALEKRWSTEKKKEEFRRREPRRKSGPRPAEQAMEGTF